MITEWTPSILLQGLLDEALREAGRWLSDAEDPTPAMTAHHAGTTRDVDGGLLHIIHVIPDGEYDSMAVEIPVEGGVVCEGEITSWNPPRCARCPEDAP